MIRHLMIHRLISYLCLVIVMLMTMMPSYGFASANLPQFNDPTSGALTITNIDDCAADGNYEEYQITSKVVYCIRLVVMYSVGSIMGAISSYIEDTLYICFALACAFLGARILGGEPQLLATVTGTLIRWGVVFWFFLDLESIAYYTFATTDWLIGVVTPSGFVPWEEVDAFIAKLFGFAPDANLSNGITGMVFAALLSSTGGGSMFGVAAGAIYGLWRFVLEIVYVYLVAMLVIGFMMVIAPLIVPLTIFKFTERYFTKWLKNIIGAMLMPVMLYCFLGFSLSIFDTLITDTLDALCQGIYDARGNPKFEEYWKDFQPQYSWIAPGDPTQAENHRARVGAFSEDYGFRRPKIKPPMATEHNPFNRVGQEMNSFANFRVSYDSVEMLEILYKIIALFVYANIMLTLVKQMPMISRSIAGSAFYDPRGDGRFDMRVRDAIPNAAAGAGFLAGGWAGSQLGGMVKKGSGNSYGAWAGAVLGAAQGRRAGEEFMSRLRDMVGRR